MIEDLPLLTPDPARADRLRARCHARLEHIRRSRSELRVPRPSFIQARKWERAIVGGVCVIYISAVVRTALQVWIRH